MTGIEIIALVVALAGILAGAYAILRADVQAAGGAAILACIAIMIVLLR